MDLWLLYLDEDVPLPLAITLRMLGYDVVAPAVLSEAVDEFARSMRSPDNQLFVWDRRIGWYDPFAPKDHFRR